MNHRTHLATLALAAAVVISPLAASAQAGPPMGGPGMGMMHDRHHLMGRVASYSGYNLQLDGGQHVRLHQGTVINPTGWTHSPGPARGDHGFVDPRPVPSRPHQRRSPQPRLIAA